VPTNGNNTPTNVHIVVMCRGGSRNWAKRQDGEGRARACNEDLGQSSQRGPRAESLITESGVQLLKLIDF